MIGVSIWLAMEEIRNAPTSPPSARAQALTSFAFSGERRGTSSTSNIGANVAVGFECGFHSMAGPLALGVQPGRLFDAATVVGFRGTSILPAFHFVARMVQTDAVRLVGTGIVVRFDVNGVENLLAGPLDLSFLFQAVPG